MMDDDAMIAFILRNSPHAGTHKKEFKGRFMAAKATATPVHGMSREILDAAPKAPSEVRGKIQGLSAGASERAPRVAKAVADTRPGSPPTALSPRRSSQGHAVSRAERLLS